LTGADKRREIREVSDDELRSRLHQRVERITFRAVAMRRPHVRAPRADQLTHDLLTELSGSADDEHARGCDLGSGHGRKS
jgi:hypothetical protein